MDKEMRIEEGVLRWFGHVERDRIAKRVYVGEYAGLDVRQARRMVHDSSVWRGFVRGGI